ncbi:MAG: DNA polymerase [bacterium]|nr:DNA polymerase [bacterium]
MNKKKGVKRVVLIDTHAVLHRGYHALPDFTTSSGEHTGAIYGLATFLLSIIKELQPDYLVAAYDLPGQTFRHEQYDEYKATRGETDKALIEQFDRSRQLYEVLGIPIYDAPGFEADDVLGTAAEQLKKRNDVEVLIASGDMDTLQLVDGTKVRVYTLRRGLQDTVVYDEKTVKARFGFKPELLIDYKGLRGDPSDNIPGVPGIGEKTATTLIATFGSLDKIYASLEKNREAFVAKEGIKERTAKLLEENKDSAFFSRELATIRLDAPVTIELGGSHWVDSVRVDELNKLFEKLEFRTLSPRFISAIKKGAEAELNKDERVERMDEVDEIMDGPLFNKVRIMYWLLQSDRTNVSASEIINIAGVDTLGEAEQVFLEKLKEKDMLFVWEKIEEPLMPIVQEMQNYGVLLDVDFLNQLKKEYTVLLKKHEKKIHEMAGVEFNVNSPKQLGKILFEKIEIKGVQAKRTATGAYSTSATQLEKMRDIHPIAAKVLEYRELQKLLSTYIEPLPALVDSTSRVHATFDQAGTTTGRFSSNDPNLQNIPTRTEYGRAIRRAFIAPRGYELVAFDYSQIELRVAAWLSGDENMIRAFNEGGDFHAAVAAKVFNKPASDITKEERRAAKVINFGIVYGMGVNALKQNLCVSVAEAREFYDKYKEGFAGLFEYFGRVKVCARDNGFTKTFYGRRRPAPDIDNAQPFVRAQAERFAMNAPLQGTGADIVKLGMVAVDKALKKLEPEDTHLVLQVHDEIVLEVKKGKRDEVVAVVKKALEGACKDAPVAFLVDVSVGKNWGELKKI